MIFLVFVVGLIVYLFATQTWSKLGLDSSTLSKIFVFGNRATSTDSVVPDEPVEDNSSYEEPKEPPVDNSEEQINQINAEDIPSGFVLKDLSPYFKKVGLSVSFNDVAGIPYPQIRIYSNFDGNENVNITGWRVKTNRGSTVPIPRAIEYYNATGFGASGDVILKQGDYAYIYVIRSPIGNNLRLNKCTGYLSSEFNFDPELPRDCPSADRGQLYALSGRCQSFILSLSSCQIPTPTQINSFSNPNDNSCQGYFNALNYRSCYDTHYFDADFLSNEWRIWLGQGFSIDEDHDRAMLFDSKGLLVDEYSY